MFGARGFPPGGTWGRRGAFAAAFAGPLAWRGPGIGRMLAQGDLRLLTLALIAEAPRHGYDIIKALEEKTAGWYSPSPGIVYPTLTYLEEAEFVTSETEGSKKRYSITSKGRAFLDENRDPVAAILERMAAVGEQMAQWSRTVDESEPKDSRSPTLPRLVDAAVENLRELAAERLARDAECEPRIVDVLARAAVELRRI
jgi:DNA-binding PadR family transcriptional regulator